jgi:hypothetical protein
VTNAQGLLQGAATGGTLDQIGQVGPLDPAEGTARHGVDVAAAYVYAVASDILTPTHDLPVAFAAVYFPHPDTQLQGEAPTQRANDLHLAWMGVTRLAYGIGPVVFAFFESLTNLLWTLAGGFLFLAGVLSVAVCWFPPAQHIVYGVARKAFEVIVTSWGASILQAVLMAFVFALAGAQSATLLLGACIVGLFLALVFCWIAATTFYAALGGVVTAVTAGGVRAQELERGAAQARQQMIDRTQAVGGTLADAYAGTHDGKHAAGVALKAYRVASKNGPLYGATYAVPALAQLGALARLMNPDADISPALDRAAYTRTTAGQADPLAPRALHAIDRDHAALTKTKHEATDAITDPVERTARGLPPLQSAVPSAHPPSAGRGSADGAGGGVPGQSA